MVDLIEVAEPEKSEMNDVTASGGRLEQPVLFAHESVGVADHREPLVCGRQCRTRRSGVGRLMLGHGCT